MVTAGRPYYAPLADIDFEEARRVVDAHLWLAINVARAAPERSDPAARCSSWAAPAAAVRASGSR